MDFKGYFKKLIKNDTHLNTTKIDSETFIPPSEELINRGRQRLSNNVQSRAFTFYDLVKNDKNEYNPYFYQLLIYFLLYYEMDNFKQAEKILSGGISEYPNDSQLYFMRGMCRGKLNNLDGKIEDLNTALKKYKLYAENKKYNSFIPEGWEDYVSIYRLYLDELKATESLKDKRDKDDSKELKLFQEKHGIVPDHSERWNCIQLTLADSTKVSVLGFNMEYTYSGFMEGRINQALNQRLFDRATYPKNWGERPIYKVIPPKSVELPPVYYSALLISDETKDIKNHGSELVILWFGSHPKESIEEIIKKGVNAVDWNVYSKDYQY